MRIAGLSVAIAISLSACTFVKMAPGGAEVQVVSADRNMSGCEKRGEIEVSVKDRLGPYERDEMRVLDELETLARNEAPGLRADTVQPKNTPRDGEQRFVAYRCAGAAFEAARPATEAAETVPLQDD
ncbi:MAG: DUF4156 domain-containing protein [Arenimonas sp.]|jgi:hypothetical protein